MQIVNWNLVKHPMNWATVILMLLIAAVGGALVLQGLGVTPKTTA
jgi:hypothetical protein